MNEVALSNPTRESATALAARRDASAAEAASSEVFSSAIYEGWVRHRRYFPHAHEFRYRIFLMYVDLSEIDRLFERRWLWSNERGNLAQFRRSDYLGDPTIQLAVAVRDCVRTATGRETRGPIRLLTHLRYFGFCFNPVSFYYCFAPDGTTLEYVVAQITNTPWRERHAYVLSVAAAQRHAGALGWEFPKAFHVSPFLPMQRDYRWRLTLPDCDLRVHMQVVAGERADFDATLVLERKPLDGRQLARCLWRFPLMTLRIVLAIHWQALLIFLRRNPVYDHPDRMDPKR